MINVFHSTFITYHLTFPRTGSKNTLFSAKTNKKLCINCVFLLAISKELPYNKPDNFSFKSASSCSSAVTRASSSATEEWAVSSTGISSSTAWLSPSKCA